MQLLLAVLSFPALVVVAAPSPGQTSSLSNSHFRNPTYNHHHHHNMPMQNPFRNAHLFDSLFEDEKPKPEVKVEPPRNLDLVMSGSCGAVRDQLECEKTSSVGVMERAHNNNCNTCKWQNDACVESGKLTACLNYGLALPFKKYTGKWIKCEAVTDEQVCGTSAQLSWVAGRSLDCLYVGGKCTPNGRYFVPDNRQK
jgi:hypothetical protein